MATVESKMEQRSETSGVAVIGSAGHNGRIAGAKSMVM